MYILWVHHHQYYDRTQVNQTVIQREEEEGRRRKKKEEKKKKKKKKKEEERGSRETKSKWMESHHVEKGNASQHVPYVLCHFVLRNVEIQWSEYHYI